MGNDKKKTILDIMNKFILSNESMSAKKMIEKFRVNAKQIKIQR